MPEPERAAKPRAYFGLLIVNEGRRLGIVRASDGKGLYIGPLTASRAEAEAYERMFTFAFMVAEENEARLLADLNREA